MTELYARYQHAKERRAKGIIIGFVIGTFLGAVVIQDSSTALLLGLISAIIIGIGRSWEVNRWEKIIYPGGKR